MLYVPTLIYLLIFFNWLCYYNCTHLPPFTHSSPPPPSIQHPASLQLSSVLWSRPWAMRISSLATPFPILYFTSLWLFCNYLFVLLLLFVFKIFIYLFLERGMEGEWEEEKYQCVVASHVAPTRDLAHNPGICPDNESNLRPFGSQPTLNPLSYTSQGSLPCMSYKLNNLEHSWDSY